jgi:Holliday junction resolvase RusA-like endonuclease
MPKKEIEQLVIKLTGRIPSKKNSRCLFVRGGRLVNIPSAKYAEWHKAALAQVSDVRKDNFLLSKITVEIDFFAPDKRASDLSNKAESIMDLLVDAGIIADDNWWVVDRLILNFRGVDKNNPGAIVSIKKYETMH